MAWYLYIMYFFAGAFLANSVPHFVSGVSGRKFPTPFAHPPGRSLSSPTTNVLWGLGNFIVGCLLLTAGQFTFGVTFDSLAVLVGTSAISIMASKTFSRIMIK